MPEAKYNMDDSLAVISSKYNQMILECLKSQGYTKVKMYSSIQLFWTELETSSELPTWIITEAFANEPYNVFQLLSVILKNSFLEQISITLVVKPEEKFSIPDAFELGLFSFIYGPISTQNFQQFLKEHLNLKQKHENERALVAYSYLRNFLIQEDNLKATFELDQNIVNCFPEQVIYTLSLAESMLLNGDEEGAINLLTQVKMLHPELSKNVNQVAEQFLGKSLDVKQNEFAKVFQMNKVLIIDPSVEETQKLVDHFKELGVLHVQYLSQGKFAEDWISKNLDTSLIFMELHLPDINSLMLIQKLIQLPLAQLKIIVYTKALEKSQRCLLRECGVNLILDKSQSMNEIMQCIANLLSNHGVEQNIEILLDRIRSEAPLDLQKANTLAEQLYKHPKVTRRQELEVEALLSFYKGDVKMAKKQTLLALRQGGDALFLNDLMGKIYHKLGMTSFAIQAFEAAKEISPQNIARITEMALIHADDIQFEEAKQAIKEAKQIDATNPLVFESEAAIAIIEGNIEQAKKSAGNLQSLSKLVSYINNKGVALILKGEFEAGFELYWKCLEVLNNDQKSLRAKVYFNLGLAYGRQGNNELAIKMFDESAILEMNQRVVELLAIFRKAKSTGTIIKFAPLSNKIIDEVEEQAKPFATYANKGDINLHKIYFHQETSDAVWKMLEHQKPFKRKVK